MAIAISQPKNSGKIGKILMFLIIIGLILFAAYYLFYAETPAFDYIRPASLEKTFQLAEFDVDARKVFAQPEFDPLVRYGGLPEGGNFGRTNPFFSQ